MTSRKPTPRASSPMSFSPTLWRRDLKVCLIIKSQIKYVRSAKNNPLLHCLAGTGVTTYSLHPGVVQTDLWRHLSATQQLLMKIAKPFTKNSVQGAQTSIFCAVEPSLEKESGRYYRYTLEPILQSYHHHLMLKLRCKTCWVIRRLSFTLSHVYKAIITNILWYKTDWRQVLQKSATGITNHVNLYIVQVLFIPYFFTCSDCAPADCSAKGKDDALAQKLWELSCQMLSITWEWGTLNK